MSANWKLKQLRDQWIEEHIHGLDFALANVCESPIEQLLMMAFTVSRGDVPDPWGDSGLLYPRGAFVRTGPDVFDRLSSCVQWVGRILIPVEPWKEKQRYTYVGYEYAYGIGEFSLFSQVPILVCGRTYRPDFLIINDRPDPANGCPDFRLCIEVDGHDAHERTKQQASHDKERDRNMVTAGWHVLRFTGSDVWRDAIGCVNQVERFIIAEGKRILEAERS